MIWDDPEARRKKKIRKTAKGAASALGGGVALWFFSLLYPQHEEALPVAGLFGDLSLALVLYGIIVLGCLLFLEKHTLKINAMLVWLVLPAYVGWLFINAAQ